MQPSAYSIENLQYCCMSDIVADKPHGFRATFIVKEPGIITIALASHGVITVSLVTCRIIAVAFCDLQMHCKHSRKLLCCRGCSLELAKHRNCFCKSRHWCDCFCKLQYHLNCYCESWHLCNRFHKSPGIVATAFACHSTLAIACMNRRVSLQSLL